jgi:hypothetical protein
VLQALVKKTEKAVDDAALEACETERAEQDAVLAEATAAFTTQMDDAIAAIQGPAGPDDGEPEGGGQAAAAGGGAKPAASPAKPAEAEEAAEDKEARLSDQQIQEVTEAIKGHIRAVGTAKTRSEGDADQAKMALMKDNRPADAVETVRDGRVAALDAHASALEAQVKAAEGAKTTDDLDAAKAAAEEIVQTVDAETATFAEDLTAAQAPEEADGKPTAEEITEVTDAINRSIKAIGKATTRSNGDADGAKMALMKQNRSGDAVDAIRDGRIAALDAHGDGLKALVGQAEGAETPDDLAAAKSAAEEIMQMVEAETATFDEELTAAQAPEESDGKPTTDEITEVTDAISRSIRDVETAKTRSGGDADGAKMALMKQNLPADSVETIRDSRLAALDAHSDALKALVDQAEGAETHDDLAAAKSAAEEIMQTVEGETATFGEDLTAAQTPDPDAEQPPSTEEITAVTDAINGFVRKVGTLRTRANGDADQAKMTLIKNDLPTDTLEAVRDGRIAALEGHAKTLKGFVGDAEDATTHADLETTRAAADEVMAAVEAETATFKEDLAAAQTSPEE